MVCLRYRFWPCSRTISLREEASIAELIILGYAATAIGILGVAIFYILAFHILWPTPEYFYGIKTEDVLKASDNNPLKYISHIPLLFLSSEFGILYTFPLFPIGVFAATYLWARNVKKEPLPWTFWAFGFAVSVGTPLALVLLWQSTATLYGYRYLLPAMPGLMLATAAFVNSRKIDEEYGRTAAGVENVIPFILCISAFLVFVSLVSQFGFAKMPGFTPHSQVNVFGIQHEYSARGYMDAVFGALFDFNSWRTIVGEFIFYYIKSPELATLAQPELRYQLWILLFFVPLIGALLSAAPHFENLRGYLRTAAVVTTLAGLALAVSAWIIFPPQPPVVLDGAYGNERIDGRDFTWMRRDSRIILLTSGRDACASLEMFTLAYEGSPSNVTVRAPSGDGLEVSLNGSRPLSPAIANVPIKSETHDAVLQITANSDFMFPGDPRRLAFGLLLPIEIREQPCPGE